MKSMKDKEGRAREMQNINSGDKPLRSLKELPDFTPTKIYQNLY